MPTHILFVCHGNICRSTMAEYVMRHLVSEAGLAGQVIADSAATSREELGNTPHPGTRRVLASHGITCGDHRARQLTRSDYVAYDYIIGMDAENLAGICRILLGETGFGWGWAPVSDAEAAHADPQHKVSLLLDWTGSPRDVADPWYTHDFETTYTDILTGCKALLAALH